MVLQIYKALSIIVDKYVFFDILSGELRFY